MVPRGMGCKRKDLLMLKEAPHPVEWEDVPVAGRFSQDSGQIAHAERPMPKSRIFLLRVLMSTSSTRAARALFQPVACRTRST